MKKILNKKVPMLIICGLIITGLVLTSTPAFSRDNRTSYGNDRTHETDGSRNRDSSHDRDRSNDRDRSGDRDRYDSRHTSHWNSRSRNVRVVHTKNFVPAIIATGIVAGITLSLLDNHYAKVSRPAVPQYCTPAATPIVPAVSVTVTIDLLNIRSGPGMHHPCVGQIHRGAMLSLMGSTSGWYRVTTPDGLSGWVMSQYTWPVAAPYGG